MNFGELLHKAKAGDNDALEDLIYMYQPLINKLSFIGENFDEDLYQEQSLCFLRCLKKFSENYFEICDKRHHKKDI